ncbi:MAG: DUF624 domain-containing protein [Clostridia bacterium]|nr:DUF624 domain-containing protein [Clostridia bacterium]
MEQKNSENKIFGIFKRKEPKELTAAEIEKERNAPRNIAFFFKLLKRNFSKLLTLNFFMLFMIIPLIAALFVYLQGPTTPVQTGVVAPTLFGVELISGSPAVSLIQNINGMTAQLPAHSSPVFIIIGIILIFLAITWGWQNVGATYILRSMVRGEPVFMWSDYFYAIKKNLKQGFLMGLLDFIIMCVLAFDIFYFSGISGSFAQDMMFYCTIGLAIIYLLMRFYIYIMLITFDLSIFKLLKNALIFTTLGFKRNAAAVIGIILIVVINVALALLLIPMGIIIPVVLPLVYLLPLTAFITTYAAYPGIKKYMIDPQLNS